MGPKGRGMVLWAADKEARAELREVGPWEGGAFSQRLLLFLLEVHQLEQPDLALAQKELCREGKGSKEGEREGEFTPGHLWK